MSKRALKENQVLIDSNTTLECGKILAPTNIDKSLLSNVLHVLLPEKGFDIIGLRVPDYSEPDDSQAKCGDRINQLKDNGWQHSIPISGASYWAIVNRLEVKNEAVR
jgi:hypothetical protein